MKDTFPDVPDDRPLLPKPPLRLRKTSNAKKVNYGTWLQLANDWVAAAKLRVDKAEGYTGASAFGGYHEQQRLPIVEQIQRS